MNLGQNKFLIGLGAAFLLVFAGLGWMVFQAYSTADAADDHYKEQVGELDRLQKLDLYPEVSNLKILEDQKRVAAESAVALHQQLVPMAFPLEQLTPEQFQDQLTATVKKLGDKATQSGVNLSDKLYLGFAEYRTATPKPEAASVLGRQLKCVELVVDALIERKVASIDKITRTPLAEELDSSKAPVPAPAPRGAKGAKPGSAKVELVTKFPFEVQFVAEQKAFQGALNDLSKTTKQFFVIQPLAIKNQGEKAPRKNESAPGRPAAPAVASAAEAGATPKPEKLKYILGAEKLNVTLRFDSVVFASNLPK